MTAPNLDLWNEPSPFQNSQAYEQKNHNWDVLRNYGQYIGSYLKGITDGWDARFTAQLQQIPQPNEVIDARVDAWGHTWPNLHDHLVNIEDNSLQIEPLSLDEEAQEGMSVGPAIILKFADFDTTSNNMRYTRIGAVTFDMPGAGYVECRTTDLSINPA